MQRNEQKSKPIWGFWAILIFFTIFLLILSMSFFSKKEPIIETPQTAILFSRELYLLSYNTQTKQPSWKDQ